MVFQPNKIMPPYLRVSMGQERLSNSALLSIERETFEKIHFDDVIDQFATMKARKMFMLHFFSQTASFNPFSISILNMGNIL